MKSAKYIQSYSHHLNQDIEYFHHPMKVLHLPLKLYLLLSSSALEITGLISVSIAFLSPEQHINVHSLCVWSFALSMMLLEVLLCEF